MGQIIMGWVMPKKPHTGDVEDYQDNDCILVVRTPEKEKKTPVVPRPQQEPCGIFDCVNTERPPCAAVGCDVVGIKRLPEDF